MKITDFKNEDALDLLAELINPASIIFTNQELVNAFRSNKSKIEIVQIAIKNNKKELIEIIAKLDGITTEKADYNIITLIRKVLEILNDKELVDFFSYVGQTEDEKPSIKPTETTGEKGK